MPTTQNRAPSRETQAIIFKQAMHIMTYAGIPPLRQQMLGFLNNHGITAAYTDKLLLSLSEIITNLLKHPETKPSRIVATLTLSEGVTLDVADDSTPFATFDAKCKAARMPMHAAESLAECGYGVGCILKQHKNVYYAPATESADGLNHFILKDRSEPKKIVFLIDDDPVILKAQHRMLASHYDVVPFNRAADAIAMFRQQPPDLIISDLHMPDIDGPALRRSLSQLPGGNTTPFIFLSSAQRYQDNPYINELGVDDFLCKPISEKKLLNVIERLLMRAKQVRNGLEGKFHEAVTDFFRPALPARYHSWNIHTYSRVAEAGGGDFTLYHETPEHLFVVLADVMGHGTQAKFFSYAYAGYLRSLFRFAGGTQDAARFLQHLSKTVEHDAFLDSVIVTCQSFQLFPDGRVHVSSAGHPAPVAQKGKDFQPVDIAGPLPGLAGDSPYRMKEMQLKKGERLIFATDGFFQAFDTRADDKKELCAALERSPYKTAEDFWQLFHERRSHMALPDDDSTLIVAEFGGTP